MNTSYTLTAKILHWIMAALFIFVWCVGFYSDHFILSNTDTLRHTLIGLHKNIATTIIFLFCIRLFWRYTHPVPDLPHTMSPHLKKLTHFMHICLYIVLIMMPVTGCLLSWSVGYTAPVLYLFDLPTLIHTNPELKAIIKPTHIYLSWIVGIMVVGHIAAALKHHFIDKDNVFKSMMFK
ncbi:Cytochrome b561 (CybB) (PDB:5OC0) [Commensalibacter communis]|uniref:cytochrome b n=1 Tax=Commensalibacter communis TaxID=2972786 RepID=UPI0022FFBA24|nr:cytochrome b [Commensalibacter communis]CAI3933625.1 Cytochrome b561 (CybB) (PDB:5OC0) [Commensalibacter communis]